MELNSQQQVFLPISTIRKIMFIFGVDVLEISPKTLKKTRWREIYQKVCPFLWCFLLFHSLATFFISDIVHKEQVKAMLPRKLCDLISSLLWYTLMIRADQIIVVIKETFALGLNLKTRYPTWLVRFSTLAVFVSPLCPWLSVVLYFNEKACANVVGYYTLVNATFPVGKNCLGLFPIMLVNFAFIQTLLLSTASIYMIICWVMRNLLNAHSVKGEDTISKYHVMSHGNDITEMLRASGHCDLLATAIKIHFETYDKIVTNLKSIESKMSFPIFLVQVNDLVNLFSGIVQMDPFSSGLRNPMIFLPLTLILTFHSLLSFLCVSLFAAAVNEADKKAQGVNREVLKLSRGLEDPNYLLMWRTSFDRPFTLSAWGFFHFTKGFALSAIGGVLAYSMLIIQI